MREEKRRGPSKTSRTRRGARAEKRSTSGQRWSTGMTHKTHRNLFLSSQTQTSHRIPSRTPRRSPDNPDVSSILFNYFAGTLTSGMREEPVYPRTREFFAQRTSLPKLIIIRSRRGVCVQPDCLLTLATPRADGRRASKLLETLTKTSSRTFYMFFLRLAYLGLLESRLRYGVQF